MVEQQSMKYDLMEELRKVHKAKPRSSSLHVIGGDDSTAMSSDLILNLMLLALGRTCNRRSLLSEELAITFYVHTLTFEFKPFRTPLKDHSIKLFDMSCHSWSTYSFSRSPMSSQMASSGTVAAGLGDRRMGCASSSSQGAIPVIGCSQK